MSQVEAGLVMVMVDFEVVRPDEVEMEVLVMVFQTELTLEVVLVVVVAGEERVMV